MKRAVRGVVVTMMACVALAGCAQEAHAPAAAMFPSPTRDPLVVHGTISVPPDADSEILTPAERKDKSDFWPCKGQPGYGDITQDSQVTLTDPSGKVIAVGNVTAAGSLHYDSDTDSSHDVCLFGFTVYEVPPGEKFYGVHVGNSNRGVLQFTEADLRMGLALSLE